MKYRLVPDILRAQAENYPDTVALRVHLGASSAAEAGEEAGLCASLTYAGWERRSNALARHLHGLAQKKQTVGLFFTNRSASLSYTAYIGAQKAGLIPFPISPRMADQEIAHVLRHANAAIVLAERGSEARMQQIQGECGLPKALLGEDELRAILDSGDPSPFQADYDEEDPCDIIYTSGTTGIPKGVITSHASINYWDDATMGQYFPSMPGANSLNAIPIFTFAGIHGMMMFNLRNGLSHNILSKFEARRFLQVIEAQQVLLSYMVPAMAELLVKEAPPYPDLASLRLITFGTAPMRPETILKLRGLFPGAVLCNLYGLTEGGTSSCACFFYPGEPEEAVRKKLKSVGQPIPPTKVLILGEDGNPVARGDVGEIVFEHPAKPRTYFKNEEATAGVWREKGVNRIYTGDLGYLDEEGNLTITDRKKDMIIRGGFNIFPSEVEEVIRTHPAVEDAAVVGIPHEVLGEDVKAFVILKEGKSLALEELQDFLKPKLSDYKIPRQMAVVNEFPRSPIGKVLKRELREQG